jgi:hypothetical protein
MKLLMFMSRFHRILFILFLLLAAFLALPVFADEEQQDDPTKIIYNRTVCFADDNGVLRGDTNDPLLRHNCVFVTWENENWVLVTDGKGPYMIIELGPSGHAVDQQKVLWKRGQFSS